MAPPLPTVYLDAATAEPLLPQARAAWLAAQDAAAGKQASPVSAPAVVPAAAALPAPIALSDAQVTP